MRQFDLVHGMPVNLPGVGLGYAVEVKGPQYKFTSQTNILRLLYASFRWELAAGFSPQVEDAHIRMVLNRASGLADKTLIIPVKRWIDSNFALEYVGPGETLNFDLDGTDIRADDNIGQGTIAISQAGEAPAFSVELDFEFFIYSGGGSVVLNPYYSVIADISDFSNALIKR